MPETGRETMAEAGACRRICGIFLRWARPGAGWRRSPGTGMTILASIVLPAGPFSPGSPALSVLSLPAHAEVSRGETFGRDGDRTFYFFSQEGRWRLFRLKVEHPMGARDLWRESWAGLDIPQSEGAFRLQSAAIGAGHLFLGGEEEGGGPVVRAFQFSRVDSGSGSALSLTGKVDYFPSSSGGRIRTLYLDRKARILWLGYDSGRVESGPPYLVFPSRLLWSDPAGYLPLPSRLSLAKGPPPLLLPKVLKPSGDRCFSCRFYVVSRNSPDGEELVNRPLRSPDNVGGSLGLFPAGQDMGLFLGRDSFLCRVGPLPAPALEQGVFGCHPLVASLPVSGVWWGNRLAYLLPPGFFSAGNPGQGESGGQGRNRWTIALINPAFMRAGLMRLSPGRPFPLREILGRHGTLVPLPAGASPRRQTFSAGSRSLVVFGRHHLYRLAHTPPAVRVGE